MAQETGAVQYPFGTRHRRGLMPVISILALAIFPYPNTYDVAMSRLGDAIIYRHEPPACDGFRLGLCGYLFSDYFLPERTS